MCLRKQSARQYQALGFACTELVKESQCFRSARQSVISTVGRLIFIKTI